MLITTKGIILNSINYSETSIIVRIFTQQLGLQSYIVNGVRKAKAKNKSAIFQPLTLVDLVVYHKETNSLNHIKEIKISIPFQTLHTDVRKSCVVLFLSEVLFKTIKEQEQNSELFEFINKSIVTFDENDDLIPIFHVFFLSRLTKYLGFSPKLDYSVSNCFFNPVDGVFQPAKTSNIFNKNLSQLFFFLFENTELRLLDFNKQERMLILDAIIYYYGIHINTCNNIKSLDILKEVFE